MVFIRVPEVNQDRIKITEPGKEKLAFQYIVKDSNNQENPGKQAFIRFPALCLKLFGCETHNMIDFASICKDHYKPI